MSALDRRKMLERDHPALSIRGQCRLLGIARSGVYRPAAANDDADLALMRFTTDDVRIKRWTTGHPWRCGARARAMRSPATLWT
jgi:hypothetical protein